MQPLLQSHLPQLQAIFRDNHVARAYAFGSVCTERFNDKSDVDVLVTFEDNVAPTDYADHYFSLIESLETLLQRPVDVLTERSLTNPYFIKVVNQTKTPLYER